ncbi:L,D-transpeptidase family protein [Breoghania sp. L-A4]|uniref:L,D-transpeptidase family protein n=1 Tax=Breoghania sp. L-A4 TaxID=2304600 RepID=UPI000E35B86A|nr:L,D-transpeptidase family protein [Breoghania sp. L-A4]AXS42538.1 murein L,D-transpeptidase [Breoghania sp. L-A4]
MVRIARAGAKVAVIAQATLFGAVAMLPLSANAQSPLQVLQQHQKREEWKSRLDETIKGLDAFKSDQPTLSADTVAYLERSIEKYRAIVANGGWAAVPNPPQKLRMGARSQIVVALRQRLMTSGDMDANLSLSPSFDSDVDEGVRRFQVRHGLTPDGILDRGTLGALNVPAIVRLRQLETNIVRVRAMSGFLGERYVMVNIPAAEIEAVDNGVVRSRHTAVVGKIDRQTPILASKIYELNFNPYWTVPVSIIRKDLIPKMSEDPEYLARNKIRIYDWNNNELDSTQIDWNTDDATKLQFRQDPGEENSLGSVRINFHNQHQVYLHDTPSKSLFTKDYRFDSSGCVRVQNVRDLVTWLLESTTPDWSRARVDQTIASGERLDVKLDDGIPLYLTYVTAWSSPNGVVHFREDIYNRDGLGGSMPEDGPVVVLQ